MPGSCWNHMMVNWFVGEGVRLTGTLPGGGNYGPESLATMFRTILALSALAAGLVSSGAFAAPTQDNASRVVHAANDGGILVAQDSNLDIYYDARGNRVIVDADTGKVI